MLWIPSILLSTWQIYQEQRPVAEAKLKDWTNYNTGMPRDFNGDDDVFWLYFQSWAFT